MKITDYICCAVISLFISLSCAAVYDASVISPRLKAASVKVIDIDRILSSSEKQVKAEKLSIASYKQRIEYLETAIAQNSGIIFNKYIRLNNSVYPLVFGGEDLTDYFLKHIEAIE